MNECTLLNNVMGVLRSSCNGCSSLFLFKCFFKLLSGTRRERTSNPKHRIGCVGRQLILDRLSTRIHKLFISTPRIVVPLSGTSMEAKLTLQVLASK
jgi:hypothetical protein